MYHAGPKKIHKSLSKSENLRNGLVVVAKSKCHLAKTRRLPNCSEWGGSKLK